MPVGQSVRIPRDFRGINKQIIISESAFSGGCWGLYFNVNRRKYGCFQAALLRNKMVKRCEYRA